MRKENIYNNSIFAASRAFFLWLWVSYQRTQINGCKRNFLAFGDHPGRASGVLSSRLHLQPWTLARDTTTTGQRCTADTFCSPITRALYAHFYYGLYIYYFLLLYIYLQFTIFCAPLPLAKILFFYTNIITL